MISRGGLPHKLQVFLTHPRVLKVGWLVNVDLARLRTSCHMPQPITGGIDLARFAKDRNVIHSSGKIGLSDLCAIVLRRRLNKNTSVRISEQWENVSLRPEQLHYAAADACAALLIYESLAPLKIPIPLSTTQPLPPPGSPILIYSMDNTTVIAKAQIPQSPPPAGTFNDIRVTSSRLVAEVITVLVPGAIIPTHQKRSLESFGPTPFSIVCLRSHARLYDPVNMPSLSSGPNIPSEHPLPLEHRPTLSHSVDSSVPISEDGFVTALEPLDSVISIADLLSQDISDTSTSTLNLQESSSVGNSTRTTNISGENQAQDHENLIVEDPNTWDFTVRSRVLKDVWHVFHMFYISATHGLQKQFTRELR